MDDLITISKRDAIETLLALTGHKTVRELAEHVAEHELEEFYDGGVLDAIDAVIDMPSAQPESCEGCKWEDAFGYGECDRCKRRRADMYEKRNV